MRVLYLTHRLPYAPNRGDRVRAYHTLRLLAERAQVDLLSLVHDAEEERHASDLDGMASSVTTVRVPRLRNLVRAASALPTDRPLTHVLLDAPELSAAVRTVCRRHTPDVVLAFCSGMARLALQPPLDDVPLVLDLVDVDSAKWRDLAARSTGFRRWIYTREAHHLGAFEAMAAARASATLVVNEREAVVARGLAPLANIQVVGNGIDLESLVPPHDAKREARVVFCGVMSYEPNADAAMWLTREIWPLVRAHQPHARLTLVGANPPARLKAACEPDATIELSGTVPDVRPYLWRSTVAAAPLRVARGLQNKVLEALAAGLPTVVTPEVSAGLPPSVRNACPVADAPEGFASAICDLLDSSADARHDRVASAELGRMDWGTSLAPLWPLLESASAT